MTSAPDKNSLQDMGKNEDVTHFSWKGFLGLLSFSTILPLNIHTTIEEMAKLFDHGVDADFLRSMKKLDLEDLTIDTIVQLYDNGVDADFVREMRFMQSDPDDE